MLGNNWVVLDFVLALQCYLWCTVKYILRCYAIGAQRVCWGWPSATSTSNICSVSLRMIELQPVLGLLMVLSGGSHLESVNIRVCVPSVSSLFGFWQFLPKVCINVSECLLFFKVFNKITKWKRWKFLKCIWSSSLMWTIFNRVISTLSTMLLGIN